MMFGIELDRESAVAVVEIQGELRVKDFDSIASVIDPYIKEHGKLNGLIINTEEFPGWESFAAMIKHFKFVKSHEKEISKSSISHGLRVG